MKKRQVFEIAYKEVDLGGNFERILFLVNRMKDKITCGKVQAPRPPAPRWYPCFDLVVGVAWAGDPESYAGGGSVAPNRAMTDRSTVMTQTKRDTLVFQVGGWAWG
jgi:hypothetical protein